MWYCVFSSARHEVFDCLLLYWPYGVVFGGLYNLLFYGLKGWFNLDSGSWAVFSGVIRFGRFCVWDIFFSEFCVV